MNTEGIEGSIFGFDAEKAGEARFYPIVTDQIGTPKELFNVDGQCVWQAEHNLWGRTSIVSHKSQDFNALPESVGR